MVVSRAAKRGLVLMGSAAGVGALGYGISRRPRKPVRKVRARAAARRGQVARRPKPNKPWSPTAKAAVVGTLIGGFPVGTAIGYGVGKRRERKLREYSSTRRKRGSRKRRG